MAHREGLTRQNTALKETGEEIRLLHPLERYRDIAGFLGQGPYRIQTMNIIDRGLRMRR